ncbi:DUF1292 domain-containing protein [Cohnella thermotolerans]|jgi:uncharacterized protein YrzB (UPF0473 family)|uniref:DUF1292 domain-containing protein n=1 Tax=Cohnella thermotolerans TaxID=329858 RepID=UPI000419BA9F|nr:DUF1292 domain-containing protein [Cohnella thermotolerans]
MTEASKKAGRAGSPLRSLFGDYVELDGAGGAPQRYKIMAELEVDGRSYAVLQSDAMRKEGDIEVFRVAAGEAGSPQLETVEDDEEWENVAEAYDDLLFGSDERP